MIQENENPLIVFEGTTILVLVVPRVGVVVIHAPEVAIKQDILRVGSNDDNLVLVVVLALVLEIRIRLVA
jgi:hypothetical protein